MTGEIGVLDVVDLTQQHDETLDIEAETAVIATGFSTFDPREDKRGGCRRRPMSTPWPSSSA
jgi:heterodisulfide reductase subunit A-like polyferredoxin